GSFARSATLSLRHRRSCGAFVRSLAQARGAALPSRPSHLQSPSRRSLRIGKQARGQAPYRPARLPYRTLTLRTPLPASPSALAPAPKERFGLDQAPTSLPVSVRPKSPLRPERRQASPPSHWTASSALRTTLRRYQHLKHSSSPRACPPQAREA